MGGGRYNTAVGFAATVAGGNANTATGDFVFGMTEAYLIEDGKVTAPVRGATFIGNKSGDPAAKETASRRHGNNGSAVIDGDRIFVPVGSVNGATLVAFDKKSGKELWRAGDDNTAYSSVMFGTLAGVKQAEQLPQLVTRSTLTS